MNRIAIQIFVHGSILAQWIPPEKHEAMQNLLTGTSHHMEASLVIAGNKHAELAPDA